MNNSIEIQLINTFKNDILNKINKKLNDMTINNLINFYNNIKNSVTLIDNKTNFQNIINVDYLFEHNIASFIDINTLLELRLVNKSLKTIIYNSKTSNIFKPKILKSIEIISNIFKNVNNWNLSECLYINSTFYHIYMNNITSNSLNILVLEHNEDIDNLIVKYLSHTYSSNKIKELYLHNFNMEIIHIFLRYYSTGYDTCIRSNIEKLYIYSSNLQDFNLIPQIKGIKSIFLDYHYTSRFYSRGYYLWIDEIENYKCPSESYEHFKIIDDNMKKSIIDEAISKGYILEKDVDIIYKNLIKKDINISDMFKNTVSLCVNNINDNFILSIPHLKNLKTLIIKVYSGSIPIASDTLESIWIAGFKNNSSIPMDLLLYMPNIVDIGIELVNFFLPKFPFKILNKVILELKHDLNANINIIKSNIKCTHLLIRSDGYLSSNDVINEYTNYINDLLNYIDRDTLIYFNVNKLNICKIFIDKLNLFTNIKKLLFNDRVFVCENNKNSHLLLSKSSIKDHLITKSIQEYYLEIRKSEDLDPIVYDIINNISKGTIISYHYKIPLFSNNIYKDILIIYKEFFTSNYNIVKSLEDFYSHNIINSNIKITISKFDDTYDNKFANFLKKTYNVDYLLTGNKIKTINRYYTFSLDYLD